MKANVGLIDRAIRVVIALVVLTMYMLNEIEGTLAYVLLALSAIFVITSFISFCPLYYLFKINTKK